MKLQFRTLPAIIAALLVSSLGSTQAPTPTPFSADTQMTSERAGGREMAGKIYVGEGRMRWESQGGMGPRGGTGVMIINFATGIADMIMPEQKVYMEFGADQPGRRGPVASLKDPFDPNNPCANQPDTTCKKIGVETVNGRTCDHWEVTHQGDVANMWIDQKIHFPIKTVTKDSKITLTNIKEGEPDPSLFQIPAGYLKMDMGAMMGGRPPQQ